jgi:hypothetical protein
LARVVLWFAALCASSPIVAAPIVFTPTGITPANGWYRPDIQASYPQVDWQTLDVLCLPPGQYKFINIGNLPVRSAERPLRISNCGGQVRVGGLGHYYLFVLGGGAHWSLTGRHDAALGIGDAAFPGHAGGAYAHSQGRYGILIDDGRLDEGPSGIAVGGGATDYEIEYVEVRRVGFAGMLLKTDNNGAATMANVRIHDTYVHDTGSEGLYMGSTQAQPQHRISGLSFYNNRFVRTGTEIFQLGHVGGDSEVHHNVFFLGALDWKGPFQAFQDNATQHAPREGSYRFHHNIVIGGAGSWMNLIAIDHGGDTQPAGSIVEFSDNYFSHSRSLGIYLARFTDDVRTVRIARNWFSRIEFQIDEVDPAAPDYQQIIRLGSGGTANSNPIQILDNRYQGAQSFISNWSMPNQTVGNVSASGNQAASIPALVFANSGLPSDFDYFRIEIWTDVDDDGDPVSYLQGGIVSVDGDLYECLPAGGCNPAQLPGSTPAAWTPRAPMADDLRLAPDSPIQGIGLLDNALLLQIFDNGFEAVP